MLRLKRVGMAERRRGGAGGALLASCYWYGVFGVKQDLKYLDDMMLLLFCIFAGSGLVLGRRCDLSGGGRGGR